MSYATVILSLGAVSALALSSPPSYAAPPGCTPTNAAQAFTQIPLLSPSASSGAILPSGHATWPTFLTDPTLVWPLSAGDSVLIASTRTQGVSVNLDGFVTYTFPANTYANRLATIITANDATDPLDFTLPVLTASFTFADGRQWGSGTSSDVMSGAGRPFSLGNSIRNWSDQVSPNPDFVDPPSAPGIFQLYAGPATGGPGNVFSDLQYVSIPDTLRSTSVTNIKFSSYSFITSTTGLLTGLAAWPDFDIRNRHGGALSLQTQFNAAYANLPYGGYIVRDTLFGARKRIRTFGCLLSCMAMINSFFGDSVTVPDLNKYLVLNRGYDARPLCTISTVSGQGPGSTVTWNVAKDANIAAEDTILVEVPGQDFTPLVTIVAGSATSGTIIRRHTTGVVAMGMEAVGYSLVLTGAASKGFSTSQGRPWRLQSLRGNPNTTPLAVEEALADSLPVVLEEPGHFVVAHGRTPTVGADTANGTYTIRDPGHNGVVRLTDVFTANGVPKSFANKFIAARACIPDDSSRYEPHYALAGEPASGGVSIVVQGGGHLAVTDPSGNLTYYNEGIGSYVSDNEDVAAWTSFAEGLDDDPANGERGVEFIEIPGIAEGDYRVVVLSDSTTEVTIGVSARNSGQVGSRDIVRQTITGGQGYAFLAQVVQDPTPSVQITPLGTTSVEGSGSTEGAHLSIRPNPSRGRVEMGVSLSSSGIVEINVYDIAGRLVARPFEGRLSVGRHDIQWNPAMEKASGNRTGIFFVQLKTGSAVVTRRVVVIE